MYEQHVRYVEMSSFTPLVFSTFGGMGVAVNTVFKRMASLIAAQRDQTYSSMMTWIRCSISFSLLRLAVTCLCGVQSHHSSRVTIRALDLVVSEDQVLPCY